MLIKTKSICAFGSNIIGVDIEVNIYERGFPSFDIVGLAGKEVFESKQRVLTALRNVGINLPPRKITINLAPADIPKDGSFFDLPISTCLISAVMGVEIPKRSLFYGEVSLDGRCRYSKGAFLAGLFVYENNFDALFLPESNVEEVAFFKGIAIVPVTGLAELCSQMQTYAKAPREHGRYPDRHIDISFKPNFEAVAPKANPMQEEDISGQYDRPHSQDAVLLDHIKGQETAKRALLVSLAGGHNLLLNGPPGTGKTMLARAYANLLPSLSSEDFIEVAKIYALAKSDFVSNINKKGFLQAPFRNPHHTISYSGMIGGGSLVSPGEISLAHKGVLFMDEFPEFSRNVLEALRQPLEEKSITITRKSGSFVFPSDFVLLAACNPCPCGFLGDVSRKCSCSPGAIERYKKKLSGPIMDRIDMVINMTSVTFDISFTEVASEAPEHLRFQKLINTARKTQFDRYGCRKLNAQSSIYDFDIRASMDPQAYVTAEKAGNHFNLSPRLFHKLLKLSRTISDIDQRDLVTTSDVLESLNYVRR